MQDINNDLKAFEDSIRQVLALEWHTDRTDLARKLAKHLGGTLSNAISVGDKSEAIIKSDVVEGEVNKLAHVVIFQWVEKAKKIVVLWRDIILQQLQAEILTLASKVEDDRLGDLITASKQTLNDAFKTIEGVAGKELQKLKAGKRSGKPQIQSWQLQHSPWSIYQGQFKEIKEQTQLISRCRKQLEDRQRNLSTIHQLVLNAADGVRQIVDSYQVTAQETQNFIEDHLGGKPQKISAHLGEVVDEFSLTDEKLFFSEELDVQLSQMKEEMTIPFIDQQKKIIVKSIDFEKNTKSWLESEILPSLYDLWEIKEQLTNKAKIAVVNVKNRAMILAKSEEAVNKITDIELTQPLQNFLSNSDNEIREIKSLQRTIKRRLQRRFGIEKIFEEGSLFLTSPFQRVLNPIKFEQSPFFSAIRRWISAQVNRLRQFQKAVEHEDTLSNQEKIIRFVSNRSIHPQNHSYTNIFKSREYLGDSFSTGRDLEINHAAQIIEHWHKGYSGSVMLTGQRLAGKTFMGEMIAHKFFPKKTIRLRPNENLSWQGRIFKVTNDLGSALEFLQKYAGLDKPLLWIDDLENWSTPEYSLSENLEHLSKFLHTRSSSSLFVMISLSNWLLDHLNKSHQLKSIFHGEINLDRMSQSEVHTAIAIRHGATHKKLVNEDGKEVTPSEFKRMTSKVYRWSEGNIGEALNRWASLTEIINEDEVSFHIPTDTPLPDFLHGDVALLMSSIMRYKKINEYRLRKLYGPEFNSRYSTLLQRLHSLGILRRDGKGQLRINENVVNAIGKSLGQKKYLQFYSPLNSS